MIHFARPGRNYLFSGLTILIICLLTGSLVYYLTSKALIHNVETSLVEVATQGAKIVEKDIAGHLDVLETLALMEPIADEQAPVDRKLRFLESELIRSGHRRMTVGAGERESRNAPPPCEEERRRVAPSGCQPGAYAGSRRPKGCVLERCSPAAHTHRARRVRRSAGERR